MCSFASQVRLWLLARLFYFALQLGLDTNKNFVSICNMQLSNGSKEQSRQSCNLTQILHPTPQKKKKKKKIPHRKGAYIFINLFCSSSDMYNVVQQNYNYTVWTTFYMLQLFAQLKKVYMINSTK